MLAKVWVATVNVCPDPIVIGCFSRLRKIVAYRRGIEAPQNPRWIAEHAGNQRIGVNACERSLHIARFNCRIRSSQQSNGQASAIQRVTRLARQNAARAAQAAGVNFDADIVADVLENVGGIVAEAGCERGNALIGRISGIGPDGERDQQRRCCGEGSAE